MDARPKRPGEEAPVQHRSSCALALVLFAQIVVALPARGQGVVFIANGSGDFRTVTAGLEEAVAQTGASLQLETFVWSHGLGRYLSDHADHANHVAQGQRLARLVLAYRQACPCRPVFLVGHSAGSAVVLAAAEVLPPGSIERIILLAPSVSTNYDLRPALTCARCGIDNFHSRRDLLELGVGVTLAGTADRYWEPAAGRVGFRPVIVCPGDAALYAKLREHPWDPCVAWTGHHGGHYGNHGAVFARMYLLPLLTHPAG
jgi:pimeloyl-ACP methyl ester carboxylesterase